MRPLPVPGAPVGTWSIPLGRQSIPLGCQENRGELGTLVGSWNVPLGGQYPVGWSWAGWEAAAPGCGWDYGVSQNPCMRETFHGGHEPWGLCM